jgi:hypothetical protein
MWLRPFSFVFVLPFVFASVAAVGRGEEEPAELVQARTLYERDVDFVARPIRDRYISRLDSLKRSLGARGDARGAVAVQDEIDRVREATASQQALSKFAGSWKVTYSVGTVRHYVITADGQVTQDEHDGKPAKTTKLIVKGSDVLLDLQEGWVERLKINGKTLVVEHFNPKTIYPAGQPNARGTGALFSARKE